MKDATTHHTATPDAPTDQADDAAALARRWRVRRVRANWPAVHVECVNTAPRAGGHRVRAVVHLGALTPADVCVGVTRAAAAEALIADAADCRDDERMWSCAVYGDGRFLYERMVPGTSASDGDWVVHVRPVDPGAERPVLCPLRLGDGAAPR